MVIKKSVWADLKAIAQVHQSAFPHHLSSALGKSFIRKTLSWYLENPNNGFLLHIEHEDRVVGYVTAFYNDGSLKHGSATTIGQFAFKQSIISFMFRPWLVFHPEVRSKSKLIFKQIVLKIGFKKKNMETSFEPVEKKLSNLCSLLSIGVSQQPQGKGYGSRLIQAFEKEAQIRFQPSVLELSVKSENLQAKAAYMRNGWQVRQERGGNCVMFKKLK